MNASRRALQRATASPTAFSTFCTLLSPTQTHFPRLPAASVPCIRPPHPRPQELLSTTDRVVQQIDSVEYGLTDIQEYYANTGALLQAARNARGIGTEGKDGADGAKPRKVGCSIVEAFEKEARNEPSHSPLSRIRQSRTMFAHELEAVER